MDIISNNTPGLLLDAVRLRLQGADSKTKLRNNSLLCQHVLANRVRVEVTKEDGSVVFAVLCDERLEKHWTESAVNRRVRGGV